MKKRLGIFGGTFNPIHNGHLIVACEVEEKLKLNEIIFVPSASPPHKIIEEIVPFEHRLKMLKLALTEHKSFSISTIEKERTGKSYTVDTLKKMKETYPLCDLFFILGEDNLKEIKYWKDPEEILRISNLIVMSRPGYNHKNINKHFSFVKNKKLLRKVYLVDVSDISISSTSIRSKVKQNNSINFLLPEKAKNYIFNNKLYS